MFRYRRFFTNLTLLLTVFSLIFNPQARAAQKPSIPEMFYWFNELSITKFDDIIQLFVDLESGELEKRSSKEDLIKITHFLVFLAQLSMPEDDEQLQQDIQELLQGLENLDDDAFYDTTLKHHKGWWHKQWDHAKSFIKKNKKPLLIAGAVAAGVVIVVIGAVVIASSAGAAAIAAAGAGAAAISSDNDKSESSSSEEVETPFLTEVVNEQAGSLNEIAGEDPSSISSTPSLGDQIREFGSYIAHKGLDGIAEVAGVVPQLLEEIKDIGSHVLPPLGLAQVSPEENWSQKVAAGHGNIDQMFSTDFAGLFTPEAKANHPFNEIMLPPPGNFSKGLNIGKFKEAIKAGEQAAFIAEELGFAEREIIQLQKEGALEANVAKAFEDLVGNKAKLESFELFERAQSFLKPYKGTYLSEIEARELIHQTGIQTFPRPNCVPENFRVKISNKGAGIKYVHPIDEETNIRVMPGKPHSPYPYQREPYVIVMRNGKILDKFGNVVGRDSPEAHISLKEFTESNK